MLFLGFSGVWALKKSDRKSRDKKKVRNSPPSNLAKRLDMSMPLSCQKAYGSAIVDRPISESKVSEFSKNSRNSMKKSSVNHVIKKKVGTAPPSNLAKRLDMSMPLSCQKAYGSAIVDRPISESKVSEFSKNSRNAMKQSSVNHVINKHYLIVPSNKTSCNIKLLH